MIYDSIFIILKFQKNRAQNRRFLSLNKRNPIVTKTPFSKIISGTMTLGNLEQKSGQKIYIDPFQIKKVNYE